LVGEDRGGRRRIGLQIDDLDGGRYLAIPRIAPFRSTVECIAGSIIQQRWDLTAKPQYQRLPHSSDENYPANDYYNFAFSNTKTANWTKSRTRRTAYRVLMVLTAGRIDTLRQPLWMEWPQLIVGAAVAASLLLLDLTMLFLYGSTVTPEPLSYSIPR
jgi:hypothetical protein